MASIQESLLNLRTIIEYPTVTIDGTRHRLMPADAMTLRARMELEATERRIGSLLVKETLTEAEEQELSELLDKNCRQMLLAPPDVHAKLHDSHRLLIVEAFISLPRASRRPVEVVATASVPRSIGPSSSRASRDSTAAVRTRGSKKPRSASSARVP